MNLLCDVTVDRDVVDTDINTEFNFVQIPVAEDSDNGIRRSSMMRVNDSTFRGVAEFPVLIRPSENTENLIVSCVATLQPIQNSQYLLQITRSVMYGLTISREQIHT